MSETPAASTDKYAKFDLGKTTAIETKAHFETPDEQKVSENMEYTVRTIKKWKEDPDDQRRITFTMPSIESTHEPSEEFFDFIATTLIEQKYYCAKTKMDRRVRFFYISLDPIEKDDDKVIYQN